MIVVDRIVDGVAVVFFGEERRELPLEKLPEGVREGSVLAETADGFALDTAAENERRKALSSRADRLFKKNS